MAFASVLPLASTLVSHPHPLPHVVSLWRRTAGGMKALGACPYVSGRLLPLRTFPQEELCTGTWKLEVGAQRQVKGSQACGQSPDGTPHPPSLPVVG